MRSSPGPQLEDGALEILALIEPSEAIQAPMMSGENENESDAQRGAQPQAAVTGGEQFVNEILALTEPSIAMTPPLVEEVTRDVFGVASEAAEVHSTPENTGSVVNGGYKATLGLGEEESRQEAPENAAVVAAAGDGSKQDVSEKSSEETAKTKSGTEKAMNGSPSGKASQPKQSKSRAEVKKGQKRAGSSKRQLHSQTDAVKKAVTGDRATSQHSSNSNLQPGAIAVAGVDPVTGQPSSELLIMDADVELATPATVSATGSSSRIDEKPVDAASGSFIPTSSTEQAFVPANGELATAKALNSSEFEEEIRNRIIRETVQAEVEPSEKRESSRDDGRRRRRRNLIIVAAVLVVIVGIVVGVTAGVLLSEQKAHVGHDHASVDGTTPAEGDPSIEQNVQLYLKIEAGDLRLEEELANTSSRQYAAFDYVVDLYESQQIATDSIPENFALANIYLAMGGSTWKNSTGWMSDPNVCNWHGVHCENDQDVNVTELNLDSNNVSGTIPDEIYLLGNNLRRLNMADNEIWHRLPFEFHGLRAMTHLNMSRNVITGTIPRFLRRLEDVWVDIDLSWNSFTGRVDVDIFSGSHQLTNLDLSHNKLKSHLFTDELRQSLVNETFRESHLLLHNLKYLNAEANRFTGEVPHWVGLLGNLEVAQFDSNFFSGTVPPLLCDKVAAGLDLIVDCDRVDCGACGCTCGIGAPTFSPTITPRPTITPQPTRLFRGSMRPPGGDGLPPPQGGDGGPPAADQDLPPPPPEAGNQTSR